MRSTSKQWDHEGKATELWDKRTAHINKITTPNKVSQKKRRLNLRRGGR